MRTACIILEASGNKRIATGMSYLEESLRKAGYEIVKVSEAEVEQYRDLPQ